MPAGVHAMVLANTPALAGLIPGQLIGSAKNTSDSAVFTVEAVLMTKTVPVIGGHTYWVWANPGFSSTVDGDQVRAKLRQDGLTGQEMDQNLVEITDALSTRKWPVELANEYEAQVSGMKTFVITAEQVAGSGDTRLEGESTRPSFLRIYYQEVTA